MAVRQTGGRDPHRGIRISDAPAGGPSLPAWPPVPSLELPTPLPRPPPFGQGQRGCKQLLRPRRHRGVGGREATPVAPRRRSVRFGPPIRVEEAGSHKRQRNAGGAKETDSHAQGAQRRGHQQKQRLPRFQGRWKVQGPKASSPSTPKVVPPPPPADAVKTAPPGPQAPARGLAAAAPTPSGATAVEGVPTAPTAATASTTAMPSSTPSVVAEETRAAPAAAIEVDAGGASSSNPPPTP
eukprot:XP_008671648.1 CREB-regulated transcription coactivator 1-like [Zea mays]